MNGDRSKQKMYCKNCGNEVKDWQTNVCLRCRTYIGEGNIYCLSCGSIVNDTMRICAGCYTPIIDVKPKLLTRLKRKIIK